MSGPDHFPSCVIALDFLHYILALEQLTGLAYRKVTRGKRRSQKPTATATDRLRREGEKPEDHRTPTESSIENLIVVGASAGGHHAIRQVIRGLSSDIPAAVIIMLHRGRDTAPSKVERWLEPSTHIPIQAVQSEERLHRGRIYVTPPGESVFLRGRTLHFEPQTYTGSVTTINRLFESAAREYRDRVIGVILSGLLSDGTAGLKAVHDAGGLTIVEDPINAEYPEMPENAMRELSVTFCLGLPHIGLALDILARRTTALETGLSVSVRMLKERMTVLVGLLAQSKRNLSTHQFLSTEMRSLEEDLRSIQGLLDHAIAMAKVGSQA